MTSENSSEKIKMASLYIYPGRKGTIIPYFNKDGLLDSVEIPNPTQESFRKAIQKKELSLEEVVRGNQDYLESKKRRGAEPTKNFQGISLTVNEI